MKMLKMPSGDFIRPDYIRAVMAVDAETICGFAFAPRMIVHLEDGDRRAYNAAHYQEACEWRDEIATQINEATGKDG